MLTKTSTKFRFKDDDQAHAFYQKAQISFKGSEGLIGFRRSFGEVVIEIAPNATFLVAPVLILKWLMEDHPADHIYDDGIWHSLNEWLQKLGTQ